MSLSRVRRPALTTAVLVTTVATLAACGGGSSTKVASSASSGGAAPHSLRTVAITLSSAGCSPQHTSYHTGALTFDVKNTDAAGVSELEVLSEDRILGEKENLAPGFGGTFALVLQPGKYVVYCPGATTEKTDLTITGKATAQAQTSVGGLLQQGATEYKGYVSTQIGTLVSTTKTLQTAIASGNLASAQTAYAKARPYYERIEPVAESFTTGTQNLDSDIDARIDDVSSPAQWKGFHRIEKGLYLDKSLSGMQPVAATLVTNVEKLQTLINGLSGFQPAELANGAVSLLDEASKTKIKGEEERYSKIDLLDLSANVEGSQQAFAYLEDGMKQIDPTLTSTIKSRFAAAQTLIDSLKDPSQASGFKPYNAVPGADITKLAQALQAISEPLSQVAAKVASASK